jgi:hypothetical protein
MIPWYWIPIAMYIGIFVGIIFTVAWEGRHESHVRDR